MIKSVICVERGRLLCISSEAFFCSYRFLGRLFIILFFLSFHCDQARAGFFDEAERRGAEDNQQRLGNSATIPQMLAVPCSAQKKQQAIALILYQDSGKGSHKVGDAAFSPLFQEIDSRLKSLGLRTLTQGQIKARIAQAELEAVASNNIDAALQASRRLGAAYILRGHISSRAGVNRLVGINEVSVHIEFQLSTSGGRIVSKVGAEGGSWAGQDTLSAALNIVRAEAERIAAQIYSDLCKGG